tara:strand:- start:3809 stop:4042 length:234 start_codon:yes stop_codon:yes gene_type:complete
MNSKSSETKKINAFLKQVSKMSYEESANELDSILSNLQNNNIPVDDLYEYYLKGNILLDRCQKLLNHLEQEVVEISV